jgi:hypothetical protein
MSGRLPDCDGRAGAALIKGSVPEAGAALSAYDVGFVICSHPMP